MKKNHTFIIAEAGDNHNGQYELALQLVDKAVEAGADCVKFQTFVTENVISKFAEKAEYQKENTKVNESQYEMVKKLELSFEQFRAIKTYCEEKGILFLSTPFDLDSVDLREIGKLRKPIIMSTGMCTMQEISNALKVLRKNGAGEVILLHCNTEYPTPYEDVNLCAMETMAKEFGTKVGYSDHTTGIEIPIAAVAMGATVIEKHFTLDKNMEGPDHKASLEPDELKRMVEAIRNIEKAFGNGEKKPSPSERKNIVIARKSIVAKRDIKKGEVLTEENLSINAVKNFKEDERIVR